MPARTKFESWSPKIYAELADALAEHVRANAIILNLGPYEGNNEDCLDTLLVPLFVEAVEKDKVPFAILAAKKYQNIEVNPILMDGNDYLREASGQFDVLLSSASIHEMNTPENQRGYLDWFMKRASEILVPGGIAIIADLYFPDYISDKDVDAFREWQWNTIRHASERKDFVKPELIEQAGLDNGFNLVKKTEIRAMKNIDRRFYVVVLQKPDPTEE